MFNVQQIEGLPESYYSHKQAPELNMAYVEWFIENTGVGINHGAQHAYYTPEYDDICLPHLEQFSSKEAYIATLAHELVHWTGHKSRLDRPIINRFGTEEYAKEELVAELGATFLCADLGLRPALENHASYLDHWLQLLKNDKRAIFKAAAQAQKAVEYLHSLQKEGRAVA